MFILIVIVPFCLFVCLFFAVFFFLVIGLAYLYDYRGVLSYLDFTIEVRMIFLSIELFIKEFESSECLT